MDKLTAIKYFIQVAESGSFSKTAKQFKLPVSTVSRRIKDLEQNLGIELFRRSTRFLTLTENGEVYYRHVNGAVKSFDTAEEIIRDATGNPSGTIKLSVLPSYATAKFYFLMQEFREHYPDIQIDVYSTDQVHDLMRDKFDFAIRPTSVPPENLVARVIDNHGMSMVASPEYVKEHGKIFDMNEVKKHKALCYRSGSGAMPWYARKGGNKEKKRIEVSPHFLCNDTDELLRVAAGGEGITILPDWTIKQSLLEGEVVRINIGWEASFATSDKHHLYLIYDRKVSELKRNRVFIDFFMNRLKQ